jgi:hypothetical protein
MIDVLSEYTYCFPLKECLLDSDGGPVNKMTIIISTLSLIFNIAANALRAAAVRGLLDFIFAIRSHVHRPGITLPTICPRIAAARLLCMV